jgi:hypothetical protein
MNGTLFTVSEEYIEKVTKEDLKNTITTEDFLERIGFEPKKEVYA